MVVQPTGPSGLWEIAFADEFDDTAGMSGPTNGLAAHNWNCGMLTGPTSLGVGNTTAVTGPNTPATEIEYYGPASIVFPGDDALHLRIQAGVDNGGTFAGKTVESGMINTAGLMAFNPANVAVSATSPDLRPYVINGTSVLEVRMRWPGPNSSAANWWPVIWSSSAGFYNGTPAGSNWPGGNNYSNEIDFIEYFSGGSLGSGGLFNLHAASSYGGVASVPAAMATTDLSLAYHTYTYEMTATTITAWVDGVLVSTIAPSTTQMRAQWNVPQYLMIAFQSHSGGTFPTTATSTPSDMMIDYVRVFTPATPTLITRSGSQLQQNGSPFTFAGANVFWLGVLQEEVRYPTHTEIDDALATVVEMGGTVIHAQSLGIPVGNALSIEPTQNVFNDAAFEPIDYTIQQCGILGLHLIIPLCNTNNTYMGGTQVYSNWNGVSTDAFFTDANCISDFKAHIAHILNHVNQYTNVAIKSDPTIMMWETGNELRVASGLPVNSWTTTIATYIKSIAPNVLVADGFNGDGSVNLTSAQVALSSVDAYTLHYYGAPYSTYASQITTATTLTNSHSKVCYIGEWDWLTSVSGTATTMASFCTTIETSSLSGDTFWSLMCHADLDGYDLHPDTFSMYYPGATTDAYNRGQSLRAHAYTMSGVTKPAQSLPTPPPFTQFSATATDTMLTWSGVVPARFYQLERSLTAGTGPWTVLSSTLPQDQGPYTDNGSVGGWYRVAGINGAAVKGAYSAVIGGGGTPPTNGSDPRNPYGVTIASRATPLKNIDPQVLADAVTLGMGWVRLQVRWIDIETSKGVYDFAPVDDCVSRCMKLGLNVQFAIQTPPTWRMLAGSCGACTAPGVQCINGQWHPHDPTQTAAFADILSKRYNGVTTNNTIGTPLFISAIEIGNEEMNNMSIPGAANTYAGQVCKQAKWFIPVLQKCAPVIRANSPNTMIGLPGLIKSGFGRASFMQDLYTNNCKGLFDYANIHTYPGSPGPNVPDSQNNGETLLGQINEVWNVMNANGDGAKDVWITEIGWAVPGDVTEATRQNFYTLSLDDMRTNGHVGVVNWFTMNYTDPAKNPSSPEFSLTHLAAPQYTPTFGTLQSYINKFPSWEDGSTTLSIRDMHTRFKLKTSAPVQVRDDVAARLNVRTPGTTTTRLRDMQGRFRARQVVGGGGVVKLPGQHFVNGVSNYIFGTNMSQDFATNTVRNTPVIQAQIAAGGFTVMRCNIPVSSTNAFIDQTASACNACGTQMLVILDHANLTWNQSLVTYLGDRCLMYELGNEPDLNGITTAQYLASWNSQIPTLRALNPSAAFLGPALGAFSNVNSYLIPWLKGCVTAGNLPDGVSYHVYPCTSASCDQTCCTPKSGDFQTNAGTLRAAIQSVTSAPIALCLTEWNLDATNPPKAYTVANPFNTTWTEAALDSMVAGNIDMACQWDAAGNAGSGLDDLISTTSPFAVQVQYAPMVNRIAKYAPSMPLNDASARLHVRLSGITQIQRDLHSRLHISAVAVPTPAKRDTTGRYRSRQIIKGGGGGGKATQIMIVMMENRSWQQIFGSGKANWPLTNALAAKYANTTNFFGTFHPSLPNYIAILAGSRLGCNTDGAPGTASCGPFANNNIVDSLESAGVSWKAYFENIPSTGYTGGDTNGYVQHHNPFVYFTNIRNTPARLQKIVSANGVIADLNAANPPRFVWVTPNINDDGHTGGAPDTYITKFVASVQQTNWYAAGGAIIVVWDEGAKTDFSGIGDAPSPNNGGGPTGCFVVSEGAANFGNFTANINQYGMMKAVCEVLGLTQLINEAHTINGDISAMFGTTGHSTAPIDFYTRFRLQFPGHIRDVHARLLLTPSVAHVQIIGDMAARLRIAPLVTTNSTKNTAARTLVRSGTAHDTQARLSLVSLQTLVRRDVRARASFTFGSDTFIRSNQSGWGVASDGETWVKASGAATPTITNNTGQITGTSGQQALMLLGATFVTDALAQVNFTFSSSTDDGPNLVLRATGGGTSYYRALIDHNILSLSLVNSTTTTSLATLTLALTTLVPYTFKFLASGQNLSAKVWQSGTTEPDWMLTTTDTTLSAPGQYGIRTRVGNAGDLVNYTNYVLASSLSALQKTKDVPTRFCLSNDGDTFTRPFDFFGAWGDSTSGSAWVQVGAFSILDTTDSQGLLNSSTGDTYMLLGTELEVDVDCRADLTLATTTDTIGIFVRFRDTDNWYLVRYLNGKFDLVASHDGVRTVIASLPTTMSLGVSYTVRIQVQKTLFSAKIWATGTTEPAAWTLRTTDAIYDGIGQWGLYGNANSATPMRYDNFVAIATSRNVSGDTPIRLVLQDFGTLDLTSRMVLLNTQAHDTRTRLVFGIVSTHDATNRLRFATRKNTDVSSRTRLLAATQQQRFFASRFVLHEIKMRHITVRVLLQSPVQQRDTQQRMVIVGRPFLDTPQRLTLAVPKAVNMSVRLHMGIVNPLDIQGRLYTVPSPLLDTVLRCNLSATTLNDIGARVVLQTLNVRDVAQRAVLAATLQKDTRGRTRLASPIQSKDASGRFGLSTPTVLPRTMDATVRFLIAIDQDTFNRANQSGWGTASGGSTWAKLVGSVYTQAIASHEGTMTGAASIALYTLGTNTLTDMTVSARLTMDDHASAIGIFVRSTATTTNYRINLNGSNLLINKDVSGSTTTLTSVSFTLVNNSFYYLKVRCIGANLAAKAWLSTSPEPAAWTATAHDSAITAAGQFGITVVGGVNADVQSYDSFVVTDAQPSLVTNDVAARVRLATSAQRSTTLRFRLNVPTTQAQRNMAVRVVVNAVRLRDATTRTRLFTSQSRDLGARFVIQSGDIFDTPARLHYRSLPIVRNALLRIPLAAQNSYPLLQRLRLQPSFAKDVQARLLLTSQVLPITLDLTNRLNMALAQDTFDRPNQTGWGNSSDGYVWTQNNGFSTLSILSNEGRIASTSTQTQTNGLYLSSIQVADVEVLLRITPQQTAGDSGIFFHITTGGLRFLLNSGTTFKIDYVAIGGSPVTTQASTAFAYTAGTTYRLRARIQNNNVLAKVWADGSTEPAAWTLAFLNTNATSAGYFGVKSVSISGTATTFLFDNFVAYDAQGLLRTFDMPQRIHIVAAQQRMLAARFQLTAIVNLTRSLTDDVVGSSDTLALAETANGSDANSSSELGSVTLASTTIDTFALSDSSAAQNTTLLVDPPITPTDVLATSESLTQSDSLALLDASRTTALFTDAIIGLVLGEVASTVLVAVLVDTLTLAGEVSAALVQSTLGDVPLVPVDQATSAIQVQQSESVPATDALSSSGVYVPSDVLGGGETVAFTYSALVADMLALLQETGALASSVAVSDNLLGSELLSALMQHTESDLLSATDASSSVGTLTSAEVLLPTDLALYVVAESSTDTSSSTDTLVIVAFSFMTGTDALTSNDNQNGLVSFVPLDTLASLESNVFALTFTQLETLLLSETVTATEMVQTLSDSVANTETAVVGLAVSGSDDAPVGTDALLDTTSVTFAPDVLVENSTCVLALAALVGDTSTAIEQGAFLLAEQIVSTDALADVSTTLVAFLVTESAVLPQDSNSVVLAWNSSDALALTDTSSVAGSALLPSDSTSVIDILVTGTLFSILVDVLTLTESTTRVLAFSMSDILTTSENTHTTTILQSVESGFSLVESTLLTLLQTEQETTPVGVETSVFLNPSAIIGTDSLLLTEQVHLLLTAVQQETVAQNEQTVYAVLVRLMDGALTISETAFYQDVSFEPVIAYLRSGLQTCTIRQGTFVARRRDGSTTTIRR